MTVDTLTVVVIATVAVALAFDVINGFHDAANSIATVVSTRVLSPQAAVLWAAFFNFIAILFFEPKVAATIGKGLIKIDPTDPAFVYVVLAGLLGAIVWDLLTWWWGLPTSSSHALIGGFVGAAVAHAGTDVVIADKLVTIAQFIVLAPLIGMTAALILTVANTWAFRRWRPGNVDKLFRRGQLLSAAAYSLGHGGNDAQKTMGIILAVLVAGGMMPKDFHDIPWWIILSCHAAMGVGTAFGGWRIVRTMGMRITKLKPFGGFNAETAGAITLFGATAAGIPVSTTHTITGAILGVGATANASAVKWGVAARIVWAWVLTIPASAIVAAGCFYAFALSGAF
jgi:inorganic phosphate transporter, PiT family